MKLDLCYRDRFRECDIAQPPRLNEMLSVAAAQLTGVYHLDSIPLLIYPSTYSDVVNIPSEKKYQLWILNMRDLNTTKFMEYVQRHFRMRYE
jgi:hypothetical protein